MPLHSMLWYITQMSLFYGYTHIHFIYIYINTTQAKVTKVGIYRTASQHNGTQAKIAQINIYDGTESY